MGTRFGGMARNEKWPPPCGIVPRLENVHWQSGAALSPLSRDTDPSACQAPGPLRRRLHDRRSRAVQQNTPHPAIVVFDFARCGQEQLLQPIPEIARDDYGRQKQRVNREERRDAGVKKELVSGRLGPETEAAFGRKREAAVADVAAASQDKRARMLCNAPLGLLRVAQEAAAESAANPAAASASTVARVAKRAVPVKDQNLRGAEAAAKARAKREEKVVQSSTRARQESAGRDAEDLAPARKAGIMLVRFQDVEARLKAQRLRFTVTSDPVDFVAQVARVPASLGKGHVVLAPLDATDYALSSQIAAAVMGGYFATPKDFLNEKGPPLGIMYCEKYKGPSTYHVAVSPALAEKFPTIQQLLLAIAQAPGSCFKFYKSERKLLKFFDKTVKTTKRLHQRTFVLATSSVRSQV